MSLFVPAFHPFAPILRLAEDLDRASRSPCQPARRQHHYRVARNYAAPRFDVRETEASYELYGELPGLAKENVSIEWSDHDTLVVSGRYESRTEKTNEPAAETAAPNSTEDASNAMEVEKAAEANADSDSYHAPTVEDEDEFEKVSNPETSSTGTAGADEKAAAEVAPQPAKTEASAPKARYWLAERSVGSFSRSFTFSQHVEHNAVSASLKDGVLNLVVPKAQKVEPRKIEIA